MAFHFHHRKLLNDSLSYVLDTCKQSCDIIENFNGSCPSPCLPLCLPICSLPCPPPPPPPVFPIADTDKPRQLSLLLIACLAVLATAFVLFTCYIIYKFYIIWRSSSRRRRPPQEDDGDDFLDEDQIPVIDHPIWYIRTIGLQPSKINAITIVKYKRGDGLVEGTDCAVCLSEFEEEETVRLLPKCNHAFHIPCIDTWLGSHTNCPMCRGAVAAAQSPDPEEALSESVRIRSDDNQSEVEMNDVAGGDCKIDLGGFEDGMQTIRRSVSTDSLSASVISAAITNALPELVKVEDGTKRGGSSSIKRSASCSAKVFL